MAEYQHIRHTFAPVFDRESELLILGSFPSVKSREQGFYYGHPRNRFWKVLSGILECETPVTIEEKREMLFVHHIAVWDVIESCDIKGSSDSSIRNVIAADVPWLLGKTNIKRIFANGNTAGKLYQKYLYEKAGMEIVVLPSTSPANAAYSLEKLLAAWETVLSGR